MESQREAALVAARQYGVITHEQAVALGAGRHAVAHLVATGRWVPAARGVYRLAGAPVTWEQQVMVVVLASGPVAAASHRCAAALLGIPGFARGRTVEVTTLRPRRHRHPGEVVHRWRVLPDHHLTVVDGVVTTRPARTLVDLAGVLHPARTERAVDNCLAAGLVTTASLQATFEELATRGRKGIAVMRTILEARNDAYVPPASGLEARFLALVREAGLPEPRRQFDVGAGARWVGRVDFAYPEAKLVIEIDSARHHSTVLDRRHDHERDQHLQAAGWRVLRVTDVDLATRPDLVVAVVRDALPAPANW